MSHHSQQTPTIEAMHAFLMCAAQNVRQAKCLASKMHAAPKPQKRDAVRKAPREPPPSQMHIAANRSSPTHDARSVVCWGTSASCCVRLS